MDRPAESYTRLGTPAQAAAEALALRAFDHPEIRAAMAATRERLASNAAAGDQEGRDALERALEIWMRSLLLRQANGDTVRPQLVVDADSAAHEWFGHVYPSAQVAADNTDNVYRNGYLDGDRRYLLRGRLTQSGPAQFVIELIVGRPGSLVVQTSGKDRVDLGNQLAILTDRDVRPDAEGRFAVTIGPGPGEGLHMSSRSGSLALLLRDTLGDWRQSPLEYSIECLDGDADAPPLTEAEVVARTARDFGPWIEYWTRFRENWMGAPSPNTLPLPAARDGGWGFGSAGRFLLSDDEAMVVTVADGGASYAALQVVDRWLIGRDPRLDFTSLNRTQSVANADGSLTYVVSPADCGWQNWLSTGGQHAGYAFMRWQGAPAGVKAETLIREVRVVKLAGLEETLRGTALQPVSPEERQRALARRRADYEARFRA
jgi:hypothetical protein